jgi:hypothetical protein
MVQQMGGRQQQQPAKIRVQIESQTEQQKTLHARLKDVQ